MGMSTSPHERERFVTQALATHADALRGFVAARVPAAEVDDILQLAALRACCLRYVGKLGALGALRVPWRTRATRRSS